MVTRKKITVGFVMFEPRSGAFIWTLGENCLRTEALKRGISFTTVAVRTVSEQAKELDALLDKGMDAIILKPMARNHAGISAFIARASATGVPVISLDSPLSDKGLLCTVGSDNDKGQEMVAEYVIQRLGGQGKIAYFQGDERVAAGAMRTRSFHETVKRHPGITICYENMLDWVAQISRRTQGAHFMREALAKEPDLNAIISTTDEGALGAMDVIIERGLSSRIIVAGFDGIPDSLMAIRDGFMDVTVRQLPRLIASRALDTIEATLRGEPVPKMVAIDVDLVTADKVDHSALDSLQLIPGLILHLASNHEEQRVLHQTIISTQQNVLETITAVSAAVSSIREPGEMMKQVVDLLHDRFDLYRASVFAVHAHTSETESIRFTTILNANSGVAILGDPTDVREPTPLMVKCILTGECAVATSVIEDGTDNAHPISLSELILPLKSGEHIMGVLLLQNPSASPFTPDVVSVMQAIAQQVAVAMDNAELYRETILNAKLQEESREKLLIAEKMASLGRLTAGIAHEMNTPLAAVRAAVLELDSLVSEYREAIGDSSINDDDHHAIANDMSKAIHLAGGAAERAAGFVRGVKSQTRDLSAQQLVRFNIVTTAQESILLLSHSLRERNCSVKLHKSDNDIQVFGSPSRLAQVITNLLTNAIDASTTQARNASQISEIDVSLEQEEDFAVIRVKDQGCGIAPEVLPKIFEPMFSTKKFGDGTGLGLTIVNDIVTTEFKGSITIESAVNQGTTFIVRLRQDKEASTS